MLGLIVVAPESGPGMRPDALLEPLLGAPLLSRAIAGGLPTTEAVTGVLVVPPDIVDKVRDEAISRFALDEVERVVGGGPDIKSALAAGLEALPDDVDRVVVQNASRVLVPVGLVDKVIAALGRSGVSAPAAEIPGAIIAEEDGALMPLEIRPRLRELQGPQAFAIDNLRAAIESGGDATDAAELAALSGVSVTLVEGDGDNRLLESAADVSRAVEIFSRRAVDYPFIYPKDLLPDDPLRKALEPGDDDFAEPTDSHEMSESSSPDFGETERYPAAPGPEENDPVGV
jgi:2-C-methyl-D-erythritol 4-phosphate cytidylyltransferase